MRHTRHGWWLEDAGPVEPTPPLTSDGTADVVIVGGGYLGLWTAWQLKQFEPNLDIAILEADLAGHGPSGRNGGFLSTLWDDLPILRESVGDRRAVDVCRASELAVTGIRDWCAARGVDAWYSASGTIYTATSDAQVGDWAELVHACADVGAPEQAITLTAADVRARCAAPGFRGGGVLLPLSANIHPARLALGLRREVMATGVRLFEHTPVAQIGRDAVARTRAGHSLRAGSAVLAVNSAVVSFAGYRRSIGVASSHMVMTEPVPDVIEALGWKGESIADCRALLHYMRTTPDGRIAFGWAGGRMGFGGRHNTWLDLDRDAVNAAADALVAIVPQLRGRAITHAWGGPVDVSPEHLPIFGSRGRVHHGFGFTGNGVGPAYLGGEILARLALDRRDALTQLALVDPDRKRMPPEPLRWAAGSMIRSALVRNDAAFDAGRRPGALSRFAASLPRRLGLRLPR
jgi:glycine/D-amino acid oxidase-like deaminating enzyme